MRSAYVGVNITAEARDALHKFKAVAGGQLEQQITLTDAVELAVTVATNHLSEVSTTAKELGIAEGTS